MSKRGKLELRGYRSHLHKLRLLLSQMMDSTGAHIAMIGTRHKNARCRDPSGSACLRNAAMDLTPQKQRFQEIALASSCRSLYHHPQRLVRRQTFHAFLVHTPLISHALVLLRGHLLATNDNSTTRVLSENGQ